MQHIHTHTHLNPTREILIFFVPPILISVHFLLFFFSNTYGLNIIKKKITTLFYIKKEITINIRLFIKYFNINVFFPFSLSMSISMAVNEVLKQKSTNKPFEK